MNGASLVKSVAAGVLDLVFAPVCLACREPISPAASERLVCRVCWSRCRPIPSPSCPRCSTPLVAGAAAAPVCRICDEWPSALRSLRSAFLLGDHVRKLVHALKYQGWEAVAAAMAGRMVPLSFPQEVRDECQSVVAVPTTAARLRERGYNQAALLGSAYAAATGRRYTDDILRRVRESSTQTTLHPTERRANVAGAFSVPPEREAELRGEHVLLADDVWTTGATALACVDALLAGGARAVSVVTFARVLPEDDR